MLTHRLHLLPIHLFLLLCHSLPSATSQGDAPTKYFEVAHPLAADYDTPQCSLTLFQAHFTTALASGASAVTSELSCTPPYSTVVVELSCAVSGNWQPRVAAVWANAVELFRTSTVETSGDAVAWALRKDVTRHSAALSQPNITFHLALENVRKAASTENQLGSFQVNVSLLFYGPLSAQSLETGASRAESTCPGRKLGSWGGKFESLAVEKQENVRKFGSLGVEKLKNERKLESLGVEKLKNERKLESLGFEKLEHERKLESLDVERFERERKLGFFAVERQSLLEEGGEESHEAEEGSTSIEIIGGDVQESEILMGGEESSSAEYLRLPSENSEFENSDRLKSNLFYGTPADVIVPIANIGSGSDSATAVAPWFRIENKLAELSSLINIPKNTYRAVLELCASAHLDEEFWFATPPDSFILDHNITVRKVNGAFRQVSVSVDNFYVGSAVPFPVVYSGGLNTLFWKPVMAMGAFHIPTYDIDLTPFLGYFLNGKPHTLSLGVTDAMKFWLVNANLHLWVDTESTQVAAALTKYRTPGLIVTRDFKFRSTDGTFKVRARREVHYAGWVNSSLGNLTTNVKYNIHFKNKIVLTDTGKSKEVQQYVEQEKLIKHELFGDNLVSKYDYKSVNPLELISKTKTEDDKKTVIKNRFKHEYVQTDSGESHSSPSSYSYLQSVQECAGDQNLGQGQSLHTSTVNSQQSYTYKDQSSCYFRNVFSKEGHLTQDKQINICGEDA